MLHIAGCPDRGGRARSRAVTVVMRLAGDRLRKGKAMKEVRDPMEKKEQAQKEEGAGGKEGEEGLRVPRVRRGVHDAGAARQPQEGAPEDAVSGRRDGGR